MTKKVFAPIILVLFLIFIVIFWGFGKFRLHEQQKENDPVLPSLEPPYGTSIIQITDEPYEIQIRKAEEKYTPENLIGANNQLRNEYTWLLALWFSENNKTFGVLGKDNRETAVRLYQAIQWIEDEKDVRRTDNEDKIAWTNAHDSITIDLSIRDDPFNRRFSYSVRRKGDKYTPLSYLRENLIHEFVHFIGGKTYKEPVSFSFIKESLRLKYPNLVFNYVEGFKVNVDPSPDNAKDKNRELLVNYNEAATELIAVYWQNNAGWEIAPYYADPKVETAIKLLQMTLDATGISVEELAKFNATTDLDGLAKRLAEATNGKKYESEEYKVNFGLWVIANIETGRKKELEDYLQKASK